MENLPVVTNASFEPSCVLFTQKVLEKTKKRIKRHFERMIKVRNGCVRRQSDAKEVTAKPSVWLFVNTVFKRLDSGDVKILNRA